VIRGIFLLISIIWCIVTVFFLSYQSDWALAIMLITNGVCIGVMATYK